MAKMIPAAVPEQTQSGAERRLFAVIRDGLSDQWTVIHSLGMTAHSTKPWAEIDFVLIGPDGLFCMEVKGGLVSREEGRWFTTPLQGRDAGVPKELRESPFQQAGSASASLFRQIEARFPKAREHLISCYCVATPDSEWSSQGIDFDRTLVYDLKDTLVPFARFIERISHYWSEQSLQRWHRSPSPLSQMDRAALVDLLAGDFNLVPSLKAQTDRAHAELVRLTDEQAELFARLDASPKVVARGGAGTGKTFLAAAEARRLAEAGGTPLLICYSKNLALHLQKLLADQPSITVRSMHSFMHEIVSRAGRLGELPDAEEADIFEVFLPELCAEVLLDDHLQGNFSALIVDEGQDLLTSNYIDILDLLVLGGLDNGIWRWFFDPNQDLFTGIAGGGIGALMARSPAVWRLTTNCRNTAPIADRVSLLSGMDREPVLSTDGPPVEIIWCNGLQQERKLVSDLIYRFIHEGIQPDQITVLSPRRLDRSCMSQGLLGDRFEIVDLSRGGVDQRKPGAVGFSTIASFKGLESDAVVLVDIDDLSTPEKLTQVYVGTSRARLNLAVALSYGLESRLSELAVEFGRRLAASI